MLRIGILVIAISGQFGCSAKKAQSQTTPTKYTYPELFRDHVYYTLSDKGKEVYYAANIHPDCVAKKGQCIQRAKCISNQMLYISRICYRWDEVCCYDNSIRFPEVAWKQYTPPVRANASTEAYREPPVLP